jgi:hypothetical protein
MVWWESSASEDMGSSLLLASEDTGGSSLPASYDVGGSSLLDKRAWGVVQRYQGRHWTLYWIGSFTMIRGRRRRTSESSSNSYSLLFYEAQHQVEQSTMTRVPRMQVRYMLSTLWLMTYGVPRSAIEGPSRDESLSFPASATSGYALRKLRESGTGAMLKLRCLYKSAMRSKEP